MKSTIKVEKEVELKTLHVFAHVRGFDDFVINGVEQEDGKNIPCMQGEIWKPVINVDTGQILNWEQGKAAEVHSKICDSGSYFLKDESGETMLKIENNYVPEMLSPKENGYGDYIILDIDENGFIDGWRCTLEGFIEDED